MQRHVYRIFFDQVAKWEGGGLQIPHERVRFPPWSFFCGVLGNSGISVNQPCLVSALGGFFFSRRLHPSYNGYVNNNLVRNELDAHPYPLLFATVNGAHLFGFASPDSDYEVRGVHILPLDMVVGIRKGPETVQRSGVRESAEVTVASQDLHRFIRLMLKRNGHVLEQLFSPLIVHTSPEHGELVELGKGCITRDLVRHYLGFAERQWKVFQKAKPSKVKPLLHVFRALLTGLNLMQTGAVVANLPQLNQQFRLGFLEDLINFKLAGPGTVPMEEPRLDLMEKEYRRLLGALEIEGERTSLPIEPSSAAGLHDLLVRVRMGRYTVR